jgi:hypothetical protein
MASLTSAPSQQEVRRPPGDRFRSGRAIDSLSCRVDFARLPHRRGEDPFLGRLVMIEDGHLAAFPHDQNAVAHREHLGQVRADQDDRHSPRGQVVDQLVDLDLGADVDTASRFVQNHDFRLRLQPLADDDLLLIAARQRRRRCVDRRGTNAQPLAERLGGRPLLGTPHHAGRRQETGQRRQRDIRRDRKRHDETQLPPVLGAIGDSQRHGVSRTGHGDRGSVERDLASIRGCDAEECQPDVGASCPDETGKSQHLPRTQVERDILKGALAMQTSHRQPERPWLAPLAPKELPDFATDHAADGRGRRQLRARRRRNPAPVAEDGDSIGDLKDLFHAVGDEENRHALLAQGVDDAKEPLHLMRGEGSRRLVHDQHAHIE